MSGQNISAAVMQGRVEPRDSLDFFPTPPWATRALCELLMLHLSSDRPCDLSRRRVWEPACGEGHMARPLGEYFEVVYPSDVHPYGFGDVRDFLWPGETVPFDWIVTNPPFRLFEQFAHAAISRATEGVALFARIAVLEGVERYRALYKTKRPALIAQFVERVPIFKGRLDPNGSTATAYCWLVWLTGFQHKRPMGVDSYFTWIPPCRKQLERPGDYGPVRYADQAAIAAPLFETGA